MNLAVMGFSSNVNMMRSATLFTLVQPYLGSFYKLVPAAVLTVLTGVLLVVFLKTRLGLSIRILLHRAFTSVHLESFFALR